MCFFEMFRKMRSRGFVLFVLARFGSLGFLARLSLARSPLARLARLPESFHTALDTCCALYADS